jgi:GAF domain-containing protein
MPSSEPDATADPTTDDPTRLWVLSRLDRAFSEALRGLIELAAEQLSIASGDAVTVRRLSTDRRALVPLLATHPNEAWKVAMEEAMLVTQRADDGLWRPVVGERRPVRWELDAGAPPEANHEQSDFLTRHPVRAILGAPLIHDGDVVGGLSMVRFAAGRPYADRDEELLVAVAERIAPVVALLA